MPSAEPKKPNLVTFVIRGEIDLNQCDLSTAAECLREAVEKVREVGSGEGQITVPNPTVIDL